MQSLKPTFKGHVTITDLTTGEILVDKDNSVHYGNMSWAVSQALAGYNAGHITHMAFGNGGSTTDMSGKILYRLPNTSNVQNSNAQPYNITYDKILVPGTEITVVDSETNYSDLVFTVLFDYNEPAGQNTDDTEMPVVEEFVFDELALFAGDPDPNADGRMLTHVIFHPTQKAGNRQLEIVYTLRIQMG